MCAIDGRKWTCDAHFLPMRAVNGSQLLVLVPSSSTGLVKVLQLHDSRKSSTKIPLNETLIWIDASYAEHVTVTQSLLTHAPSFID